MVGVVVSALVAATFPVAAVAPATAAPVGQGFNLNASDLRFILKQIKIAERHAPLATSDDPACATMLGTGENQIPNNGTNGEVLPWGLRTVGGTCNNLLPNQSYFGAADQPFPHKVPRQFRPDYSTAGAPVTVAAPSSSCVAEICVRVRRNARLSAARTPSMSVTTVSSPGATERDSW